MVDWDQHKVTADDLLNEISYQPERYDTDQDARAAAKNIVYLAQTGFDIPLGFQFDGKRWRGPTGKRATGIGDRFTPQKDYTIPDRYQDRVGAFEAFIRPVQDDGAWLEHAAILLDADSQHMERDVNDLYNRVRTLANRRFDEDVFKSAYNRLQEYELID